MRHSGQSYFTSLSILSIVFGLFFPMWYKIDSSNGFRYVMYCWRLVEYNNKNEIINCIYLPYCMLMGFGIYNTFLLFRILIFHNNLEIQKKTCLLFLLSNSTFIFFIFAISRNFDKVWLKYINGKISLNILFFIVPLLLMILTLLCTLTDIQKIKNMSVKKHE